MTNGDSIGKRIREARKALNLSQSKLSDMLDVKQSSVSDWERGATVPERRNVTAIARALSVSASWLEFGDENVQFIGGATLISVRGIIEAGVLRPSEEEMSPKISVPMIVPSGLSDSDIAVFHVRGDSADLEAPEDSFVYCRSTAVMPPLDGDLVVVEQTKHDFVERTLREFRILSGDRVELHYRSNNPRWRSIIELPIQALAARTGDTHVAWVVDQVAIKRRNPNRG